MPTKAPPTRDEPLTDLLGLDRRHRIWREWVRKRDAMHIRLRYVEARGQAESAVGYGIRRMLCLNEKEVWLLRSSLVGATASTEDRRRLYIARSGYSFEMANVWDWRRQLVQPDADPALEGRLTAAEKRAALAQEKVRFALEQLYSERPQRELPAGLWHTAWKRPICDECSCMLFAADQFSVPFLTPRDGLMGERCAHCETKIGVMDQ